MSGSSSWYVITLPSAVVIGIVVVETFLVCHAAKQEDMIKGRRDFNDMNLSRYVITLPS